MATNVGAADSGSAQAVEARLKMVNSQLRTADVTDNTLLAAFLAVPRESYVAPAFAKLAYLDQPVPAAGAKARKLMAPRTLALLLQAAEVDRGDRALEVGGGSGYGAAVLAALGAVVTLVEADPEAAAAAELALGGTGVSIVRGDLGKGAPDKAPFDLILVNGAFAVFPAALVAQLSEKGRLVALDSREDPPRGVLIRKSGAGVSERSLFDAAGDILPGLAKTPAFAF